MVCFFCDADAFDEHVVQEFSDEYADEVDADGGNGQEDAAESCGGECDVKLGGADIFDDFGGRGGAKDGQKHADERDETAHETPTVAENGPYKDDEKTRNIQIHANDDAELWVEPIFLNVCLG